jgi:hypothetical protein
VLRPADGRLLRRIIRAALITLSTSQYDAALESGRTSALNTVINDELLKVLP